MNGQFSQIFVTASSVRQPLNYSELFSLLLYCMETQAASRSLLGDLQLQKKKNPHRNNQLASLVGMVRMTRLDSVILGVFSNPIDSTSSDSVILIQWCNSTSTSTQDFPFLCTLFAQLSVDLLMLCAQRKLSLCKLGKVYLRWRWSEPSSMSLKIRQSKWMHRNQINAYGIFPPPCNSTETEMWISIDCRFSKIWIWLAVGTRGKRCPFCICFLLCKKGYVHLCVWYHIFQSANEGQEMGTNTFGKHLIK